MRRGEVVQLAVLHFLVDVRPPARRARCTGPSASASDSRPVSSLMPFVHFLVDASRRQHRPRATSASQRRPRATTTRLQTVTSCRQTHDRPITPRGHYTGRYIILTLTKFLVITTRTTDYRRWRTDDGRTLIIRPTLC